MINTYIASLKCHKDVMEKIGIDLYSKKLPLLNFQSIGAHNRHIIECYQELLFGYQYNSFSYEARKRNTDLENDLNFALNTINIIISKLDQPDKKLNYIYQIQDDKVCIETNYLRELLHCADHMCHHQAIIKMAAINEGFTEFPTEFGLAPSTLFFQLKCAQ